MENTPKQARENLDQAMRNVRWWYERGQALAACWRAKDKRNDRDLAIAGTVITILALLAFIFK